MNSRIIKKVAADLDLTQDIVDAVDRSIFRFIKLQVESGDMKGIILPYFGKFAVLPANKIRYGKHYLNNQDKIAIRKVNSNLYRLEKLIADKTEDGETIIGKDAAGSAEDLHTV